MIHRSLLTLGALFLLMALLRNCDLIARAQMPSPENAMGHDALTVRLSCLIARGPHADVSVYRLTCGGSESFVLSIDSHATAARWLSGRIGQRVPITFGEEQ